MRHKDIRIRKKGFQEKREGERGWKDTNHTGTAVKLLKRTLALHEGRKDTEKAECRKMKGQNKHIFT